MPWCEECSKFWNPNSMPPDGTCPSCGRVIGEPPSQSVPWHFWLLVIGVVVYLGWRCVQLFQWLVGSGHAAIAAILGVITAALVCWLAVWWLRSRRDNATEHHAGTGARGVSAAGGGAVGAVDRGAGDGGAGDGASDRGAGDGGAGDRD